jgi:release factor glutamine methyltransferase
MFNPPYVVSTEEELENGDYLLTACSGGSDGRQVIDEFVNRLPQYAHANSVIYLLLLHQNKPKELCELVCQKLQMKYKVVIKRKAGCEFLYIVRFNK